MHAFKKVPYQQQGNDRLLVQVVKYKAGVVKYVAELTEYKFKPA
jgi:hypothetical protein